MKRLHEYNSSRLIQQKLIKFRGLNPSIFNPYIPDALEEEVPLAKPKIVLKTEELSNVHYYIELNNFRGSRHSLLLPVRGQRTKTNKRTCRKRRLVLNTSQNPNGNSSSEAERG